MTSQVIVGAMASAIALAVGLWLAEQLRDPYSDLRLGVAELLDNVKTERGKS